MNVGSVFRWGAVALIFVLVAVTLLNHAGLITAGDSWPVDEIILALIAGLLVDLELTVRPLKDDVKTLKTDVQNHLKDHDDD